MLHFDWDPEKERWNIEKHGVDFRTARKVFLDPHRRIFVDQKHSVKTRNVLCV